MDLSIELINLKYIKNISLKNKRKKKVTQNHFYKYLKLFYNLILFILLYLSKIQKKKKLYSHINSDKWIIMTANNLNNTLNYSFLESLYEWKIVIISLNETNDNSWHISNISDKLIYLSIKDQLKLSYNIIKYIKINSYSRKNIGYLFAIEHGAKEIFEIDDDIMIIDINYINYIFNKTFYERITLCKNNKNEMVNPYSYFGLNNIWPRGYRLNNINKDYNNNIFINLASSQINLKPLIYQGLINGESDIDSIFFLTRAEKNSKIDIIFSKNYPLIYLPGNFIPVNSKNTKYLYDIFPTLILPTSLNEKLIDIFRGYIMQIYAWRYNGTIIYINSNAFNCKKNSLNDFYLNYKDLYYKLENFLIILDKEKNYKTNDPTNFILYLIHKIVSNNILSKRDLKMYKAFMKDLSNMGYIYNRNFNEETILNEDIYIGENVKLDINLVPQQKILIKNINKSKIRVFNHKSSNIIFNDILLVINYNYIHLTYLNEFIINLYKKYFSHIISITPGIPAEKSNNIISCPNSANGALAYICFKIVYEKYPNFKGYLIVNDDNIMRPWELEGINQDIPWINMFDFSRFFVNTLKDFPVLEEIIKNNVTISQKIFKMIGDYLPPKIWNDMLYLPNSIMLKFCDILEELFSKKIFHELATAFAFGIMSLNEYKIINSILIWGYESNNFLNILKNSFGFAFIHPIKLSNNNIRENIYQYNYFINGENF